MGTEDEKAILLKKIIEKRQSLLAYSDSMAPRYRRMVSTSIVTGALAATLTAGPGVGGEAFIESAKSIMHFSIPLWQITCLSATLLSTISVIINGLLKTQDYSAPIAAASRCTAKLESIEIMLEFNQINCAEAIKQYSLCLAELPHLAKQ